MDCVKGRCGEDGDGGGDESGFFTQASALFEERAGMFGRLSDEGRSFKGRSRGERGRKKKEREGSAVMAGCGCSHLIALDKEADVLVRGLFVVAQGAADVVRVWIGKGADASEAEGKGEKMEGERERDKKCPARSTVVRRFSN